MECGQIPQTISQWLASALVKDGQGNVYLNLDLIQGDCSQVEPYIDCNNNHVESESHLGNVFGTDSCGNTFIRVLIPVTALILKLVLISFGGFSELLLLMLMAHRFPIHLLLR